MSATPVLPTTVSPPDPATGPSRRTVVGAGLWSAPVLAMASSAPAFAAASNQQAIALSIPGSAVPAVGSVPVTTTVRDAHGAPIAGAPVSLAGPQGSSFGSADGVTDGSGVYKTTFDLSKTWARPGSSISISAVSGDQSVAQPLTVLGANILGCGVNQWAELGDGGALSDRSVPTPVQLLREFPSPVSQVVSTGANRNGSWSQTTAVLLADGTVWTIGGNGAGQIGDGTTTSRSTWTKVPGLSGVKQLAAGLVHFYALLTDKTVVGWGQNQNKEMGSTPTTDFVATPVRIAGLANVAQISAGTFQGYALLEDSTVRSWGRNTFGAALGNGPGADTGVGTPVVVSNLSGVTQIAGGHQCCYALKTDGTVWGWGGADDGRLGDAATPQPWTATPAPAHATPVRVQGLSGVTVSQLVGTRSGGIVLLSNGTVRAWGGNASGSLGDGTTVTKSTAVQVSGLTGVSRIAGSAESGYAILADGTVKAWGGNAEGQLGDGTTTDRSTPVTMTGLAGLSATDFMQHAFSPRRMFVLTGESTLSLNVVETQVAAGGPGTVVARVAAGSKGIAGAAVSFAATSNATLGVTAGQTNSTGDLRTTVTTDPWTTPGTVVRVDAATDTNAASDSFTVLGANVMGVGANHFLELGDSSSIGERAVTAPVQLLRQFPSPVVQISAGGWASGKNNTRGTFALLKDGTVWAIGGITGDGTYTIADHWIQVPGVSDVVQIAAGNVTTYALRRDGTVLAWGDNTYGQIGDGSTTFALSPVVVPGLSRVTQIASSWATGYALADGAVFAWGAGNSGERGDGSTTLNGTSPSKVSGLGAGVARIAAGGGGGFAVLADGSVKGWGQNAHGQVGDGTTTARSTPVTVSGLAGVSVAEVVGGEHVTFARLSDGRMMTWGATDLTQNGSPAQSTLQTSAVVVANVQNVSAISAGFRTVWVLRSDGTVLTWGNNESGQLGDGTTTSRSQPGAVAALQGVFVSGLTSSSSGAGRGYFLIGDTNVSVDVADKQISAGQGSSPVTAKVASGSKGIANVAVSLSVTSGATLGAASGQTGSDGKFLTTVSVGDLWTRPGSVMRVTASSGPSTGSTTFTVLGSNALGFGYNSWNEMGDGGTPGGDNQGTGALRTSPSQFLRVFPSPVTQVVSCGAEDAGGSSQTTIVLLKDGTVWSVGGNGFGQLGTAGSSRSSWARITSLSGVVQISAGAAAVYALLADGTVRAWGDNSFGQLGAAASGTMSATPVTVPGLSNVTQLAAGTQTVFALRDDGTVSAWGRNDAGNLGSGSTSGARAQVATVTNVSGAVQIEGGAGSGFAVMSDGSVMAWGFNGSGRLGIGNTVNQPTPVKVASLAGVTQVAAAAGSAYALLSDGSVRAWGLNTAGQLGNGSTTSSPTPVAVSNLTGGVAKIAASGMSAYVLRTDHSLNAWGDNRYGQLGVGNTSNALTPVTVGVRANGTRAWEPRTAVGLMQHSCASSRMYIITE